MATTVPAHALARQRTTTTLRVGPLALAGGIFVHPNGLTSQCLTWTGLVLLVVVPAVWSRKGYRRRAGRDVLGTILRWDC